MPTFLQPFFLALSFLTRIPISLSAQSPYAQNQCAAWFFPVGLIVGLLLALAAKLAAVFFADQIASFFLAGWIWLLTEVWLTRALHWDGLGDVCDALGSGKTSEAFWQVLHDSRIGAFGVLGVVLTLLGSWLLTSYQIAEASWLTLIIAPAYARSSPLWIAAKLPMHPSSHMAAFLAQSLQKGDRTKRIYQVLFLCPIILYAIFPTKPSLLLIIPCQFLLNRFFIHTAQKHGGLSGDFLGAAIVLSQLNFLLFSL